MPDPDLLKAQEAAALLRVDPGTVYRYGRTGVLTRHVIGARTVRFVAASVTALLAAQQGDPAEQAV